MTLPSSTELELTCSVATSNSAASSFSAASSGLSPATPGTTPSPGPMLTVRVTDGFEQKRVRKEQSSSASGGQGGGSCSHAVPGSTSLCTWIGGCLIVKPRCPRISSARCSERPCTLGTSVEV